MAARVFLKNDHNKGGAKCLKVIRQAHQKVQEALEMGVVEVRVQQKERE